MVRPNKKVGKKLFTVDVLDIHCGLGLQEQREQLRGARQSSMVQR